MTSLVTHRNPTSRPATAKHGAAPAAFATDAARWAAVQARDRTADGQFVYSVASTGIYCRPSCPSRPARRANVAFHADPAAAQRAGFRACLRCLPDGQSPAQLQAARIADACRAIDESDTVPVWDELAGSIGMSRFHFQRVFKTVTGLTPAAYANASRARRVRKALGRPGGTVTEAIYDAGFNSNARFYAQAPDLLGMTPTRYRAGGAGETIRFAIGQCSLGAILVGATDRGLCAILLADDAQPLLDELQQRFPRAELVGADASFDHWVAAVVGAVETPGLGLDLPLDLRGTAFQQRVWQALRQIPPGTTTSYTGLAQAIGAPTAVRAVASACASNRLAVVIPCHRVVRTDGQLAGYRWGLARKRQLIDREAQPSPHNTESTTMTTRRLR